MCPWSAAGFVLSEDATVAGICDGVAVPGAADTDAGCTRGCSSGAGSIPADVDVAVVGVLRRVAARFRQRVKPDQRIVIEFFWGVMPRFWFGFRRVLVEARAPFVDSLLMHRWSAAGSVLGEDATVAGI